MDTESKIILHKSNKKNVILIVSIFIVIIAIIALIILNLIQQNTNKQEAKVEELEISTQIFNESVTGTKEAEDKYFLDNPIQKKNSIKLSQNIADCKNTHAKFSGSTPELDGFLDIENKGMNTCLISYKSDLTVDCNYTLEQLELTYEELKKQNMSEVFGPVFYFGSYFDLKMRGLSEVIKQKINETYSQNGKIGNLTLGENSMTSEISKTFKNPVTGKKEIIKCNVY